MNNKYKKRVKASKLLKPIFNPGDFIKFNKEWLDSDDAASLASLEGKALFLVIKYDPNDHPYVYKLYRIDQDSFYSETSTSIETWFELVS